MKIEKIIDTKYASQIADIHVRTFKGFFLTFLGEGFLMELYKGFMAHEYSGVLGAFEDEPKNNKHSLIGFLTYSENISQFYNYLLKKKLIAFAWYSLLALFRKPKVMFRLIRALTYSKVSLRDDKYITLASIGVVPNFLDKGVGSLLINALKEQVEEKMKNQKDHKNGAQFKYIKTETDKVNNDSVNAFYLKNGFVLNSSFTTKEGRQMNEYRFYF